MKKILSLLALMVLTALGIYGQTPSPGIFNYQGVARNSVGNALVNKTINLRLTIRDGAAAGPLVYQESRVVTTNPFGLFNVQVGSPGATNVTGSIPIVNWGVNTKFIQVEIDPNGGTSFINIGAAQIASVPYSLYSSLANDLVLPFNKTQANNGPLFRVVNSGTNTNSTGVEGVTNSGAGNAAGVVGIVSNAAAGGFSAGVRGINNSTTGNGIGVYGSQQGSGWGVYGTTPDGRGVYGQSNTGQGLYGSTVSGRALRTDGAVQFTGIGEGAPIAPNTFKLMAGDPAGNGTWQHASAIGLVSGSGTLNFVPKWTPNGTTLGNSQIFDNGIEVGIGTTTPFARLTVVQNNSGVNLGGGNVTGSEIKFLNFGTSHMSIYNSGNNALTFAQTSALSQTNSAGTPLMTLTSVGNLGIGTTTPTARLSVNELFKVLNSGTVQFANGVNPLINMLETGTTNPDKMILQHSPAFPTWGLQYQDATDKFNFLGANAPVLTADLGNQRVGVGTLTPQAKLHSLGTGPVYTPLGSVQAHQSAMVAENNTVSGSLNAGIVAYANGSTLGNRGVFGVAGGSGTAFNIGIGGIANASSTGPNFGIIGFAANGAQNFAGAFFGNVQIQDGSQGVNRIFADNGAGIGTGQWRTLAGLGIVAGSGTLNFIPKWTPDGNTLGNSQFQDNGSTVILGPSPFFDPNSIIIGNTPGSGANASISLQGGAGFGNASGIYLQQSTNRTHLTSNNYDVDAGTHLMTWDGVNSNVGINVQNPAFRLDVMASGGDDGLRLRTTNINNTRIRMLNSGGREYTMLVGGAGSGFGNNNFALTDGGAGDAIRMLVNGATGNVAIGSNLNPSHKLSVYVPISSGILSKSAAGFSVLDLDAANGDNAVRMINNGVSDWHIGNGIQNGLTFSDFKTGTSQVIIQNLTGNVGVSTMSPTARMHVIGRVGSNFNSPGVSSQPAGILSNNNAGEFRQSGVVGFGEGATNENDGVIGVTGGSATNFNIGGVFLARNANANRQWGIYAESITGSNVNNRAGMFAGKVQIVDGSQGVNRVFFDDGAGTGTGTWSTLAGAGIVAGSGTLNFVPKWTPDGNTLGNSQITDDGNVVTVGSIFPGGGSSLNVFPTAGGSAEPSLMIGNGQFGGIYTEQGTGMIHFTANFLDAAAGNKIMTLDDDNYNGVGIGTTAPAAKLHAVNTLTTAGPDAVLGESANTDAGAVAIRGVITSTTPGGFSAAVRGINNGTGGLGIGVWGSQAGNGWGVYGTSPGGIGVNGNGGTGIGVNGTASSGTGVQGISSTGLAGNFENNNGANTVTTLRGFNISSNNGSYGMRALSVNPAGTGYPGEATHAGLVASALNGVGIVTSSPNNYGIRAGSVTNHAVYGENYGNSAAGVFGAGLFAGSHGVAGNAAAGTGAGGYFTGGTTALRTLGGVQLTGIGEAANRILATVPGTGQATWEDPSTVGIVSGSGTLNFIPKWTPNGTTLGNSQMFDDGADVFLGTGVGAGSSMNIRTTASTVAPSVSFHTGTDGFNIHENGSGQLNFEANNSGVGFGQVLMTIDDDGVRGVGIGTLSPVAKLHALSAATTGTTAAILGETNSLDPGAPAIVGVVTDPNAAINSVAVRGFNNGSGPWGIGVWGTQYASGWGVLGETNNGLGVRGAAFNTGTGVEGASNNGLGVYGISNNYVSGWFHNSNAANGWPTLVGNNIGAGAAVYGVNSGTGGAGSFQIFNNANNQPSLLATTNGGGNAGYFESQNIANVNNTVHILNPNAINAATNPTTGGGAGLFVRKGAPATGSFANPAAIYTSGIGSGISAGILAAVDNGIGVAVGVLQAGGRGIIGQTFVPGATAILGVAGAGSVALRTQGAITLTGIGEAPNRILATVPGAGEATWEDASTLGIVSGSGTLNYVPKWTPNGTTLGNSLIFDDGVNVGVGTAIPVAPLHVNRATAGGPGMGGQLLLDNSGAPFVNNSTVVDFSPIGIAFSSNIPGARIAAVDEGGFTSGFRFSTKIFGAPGNALAERMRITNGGDVGIGTTTIQAQLEVMQVDPTGAVINATNSNAANVGNTISAINANATSAGINGAVGGGAAVFARRGAPLVNLGTPVAVWASSSNPASVGVAGVAGDGGYGVWGVAFNNNSVGLLGQTYNPNTTAILGIAGAGSVALRTQGAVELTNIGENNGYVLTSDAVGNATWQDNASQSIGLSAHYFTGNLTIPSGVFTPVTQWTNLLEDGGANYNPITGEYTITKTGVHEVNASVLWDPFTAASPFTLITLYVNGVPQHQGISTAVAVGAYTSPTLSVSQRFNAGDVLQIQLRQESGVNQTILSNYYANSFSIQFIHR